MKRTFAIAVCVLWLSSFFAAFGQSAAPLASAKVKYDEASRIKLNGVVENIEERSLGGTCKAPQLVIILKANGEIFELEVGPKWFIDDLTWTFTKGDKLEITGWKIDNQKVNQVIVRKITRAEWNLEPRDDRGAANWLWMSAPKDAGKCS